MTPIATVSLVSVARAGVLADVIGVGVSAAIAAGGLFVVCAGC